MGKRGFTLIEVAVAILAVAILAGAMAPLASRAMDQQREYRTRELLKLAFEGCFGSRDRRVANCRADFGFDPTGSLSDLGILVSDAGTTWAGAPAYGNNSSATSPASPAAVNFLYGYNGPYWGGPLNASNLPVDGWGNVLRLVVISGAYQVVSNGKDRTANTPDDISYPTVAVPYIAHNATLTLSITRSSANITGSADLNFVYGTTSSLLNRCTPNLTSAPSVGNLARLRQNIANTADQTLQWNVPAGSLLLQLSQSGTGSFTAMNLYLDLLPGENRTLGVSL